MSWRVGFDAWATPTRIRPSSHNYCSCPGSVRTAAVSQSELAGHQTVATMDVLLSAWSHDPFGVIPGSRGLWLPRSQRRWEDYDHPHPAWSAPWGRRYSEDRGSRLLDRSCAGVAALW